MMDKIELRNKSLAVLLLSFMSLAILPACSSDSEEVPPSSESSSMGAEDCSTKFSNPVDIQECEIRNEMLN